MSAPVISKTQAPVGNSALFQTRLVAPDATGASVTYESNCLTAADVATITCTVYDLDAGAADGTPVTTPAITSAAIVALGLPNEWQNRDAIGRNFRHQVAGTVFAVAEHTYRVVYQLTTNGGTALAWAHEHTATALVPS